MRFYLSPVKHLKPLNITGFVQIFGIWAEVFVSKTNAKPQIYKPTLRLSEEMQSAKITLNLTLKCRVVSGR